jgi:hypothetical protein
MSTWWIVSVRESYEPATPICTYPTGSPTMPARVRRSSTTPAIASTGSTSAKSTGVSTRARIAPDASHTAATRAGKPVIRVSRTEIAIAQAACGLAA